ncbi:alpha/beta fold hydrolase [Salaquimonas pukyongi]|uniref:alpha/beta fold hydrolase n=1 Tax=Salaquimonas pukyongi TaxID=2712698 RepID=UPI00096BC348|nr:alpha/beta hydrolase [Salaquimonas pukyongi]
MKITLDGDEVHISTGGRAHEAGKPFVVFLHGSGFNHLTWVLQSRALAYDGYNVVAPDLPGHGFSGGTPIDGIEAQADWVLRLLDELGAEQAVLAGHSQGGLIALEMAQKAPKRVRAIVFIASAAAIPVNPKLIEMAESAPVKAYANMVDWAHGSNAHMHDNTVPGGSHIHYGIHVMEMSDSSALATDLKSCAAYKGGEEAAKALHCPVLCLLAGQDKMTPLKAGKQLAGLIKDCRTHVIGDSGHTLPTERPRQVNAQLRSFLEQLETQSAA